MSMLRMRLNEAFKEAQRGGNHRAINTLRLILAAMKDRDAVARAKGSSDGVSDGELVEMLRTMVRQRCEAIREYERGGRLEMVQEEEEEIEIIERLLPRRLDERETRQAVETVINEIGAHCIKDMGRCMRELRSRYPDRMDFHMASGIVKNTLF